jgi:hypothetical protein
MRQDRYFVTVIASSDEAMRALSTRGLDLFHPTARRKGGGAVIEGLLCLDEIAALVDDGYRVTVEASAASRARATQTTTLDAWLQAMGE